MTLLTILLSLIYLYLLVVVKTFSHLHAHEHVPLGCDIFADVMFDLIITITISSNVIGELATLFFSNHSIQWQLVIQFCKSLICLQTELDSSQSCHHH